MNTLKLTAQFQTYWHIGTGKGAGQGVDALVDKDQLGLPQVSGRMLKGLFRDACFKLESWRRVDKNTTDLLFGKRTDANRHTTHAGRLHFSPLRLPEIERQAIKNEHKSLLYKTLHSTAIHHQTGIAQDKSLRSMEVAIPLEVTGEVSWIEEVVNADQSSQPLHDVWQDILTQSASLITHIGAYKTRGFGEVILTLQPASK